MTTKQSTRKGWLEDELFDIRVLESWKARNAAEAEWQHTLAIAHKRGLKIGDVVTMARDLEKAEAKANAAQS